MKPTSHSSSRRRLRAVKGPCASPLFPPVERGLAPTAGSGSRIRTSNRKRLFRPQKRNSSGQKSRIRRPRSATSRVPETPFRKACARSDPTSRFSPTRISKHANLARFDAIVLGVRAYNVHPERISAWYPELLAYAQKGGVVVIQYNTTPGPRPDELPHPLHVSHDRVTDENAEVRILAPDHPVMNFPNKITAADFAGWVQERGLYFPDQWDPAWTPILSSNDPGEKPLDGGLLVTRCGKGWFVYTGYSWFRELPAGVPGAYRIFANLISLGAFREMKQTGRSRPALPELAQRSILAIRRRFHCRGRVFLFRQPLIFRERTRLCRALRHAARDCDLRLVEDALRSRSRALSAGRFEHSLGHDRAFGHGDAGQRDHFSFHPRAGLRERNGLCAKLLRPALRAHRRLRGLHPDLSPAEGRHGLRISRPAFRSKDPIVRRVSLSPPARAGRRDYDLRARHYSLGAPRLESCASRSCSPASSSSFTPRPAARPRSATPRNGRWPSSSPGWRSPSA